MFPESFQSTSFSPAVVPNTSHIQEAKEELNYSELKIGCIIGNYKHGTIIRTGIPCKKISCYMHDSACRWLIVENAKIFQRYVNHF